MKLEWDLELDLSVCFSLEFIENDKFILVSGESELSKIDLDGHVLWSFSGRDIFVTAAGGHGAEVIDDEVYITDWNEITYVLNFNGELLSEDP